MDPVPPGDPGPSRRERLLPVALGVAAVGLVWLVVMFVALPGSMSWGYDYEAYRNAALRLGSEGTLYQAETLGGPFAPGPFGLYLYPPPLGVILGPSRSLSLDSGVALWFLAHLGALAVASALMPVRTIIRVAAFGVAALSLAVIRDFALGNVSVLLLIPLVVTWRWLDRPAGSIALAAAMAVRPTLGVILLWQLLRREWRAVAWAIGAGVVLIVATLPFVGVAGYVDYLTVLRNLSDVTGVERNVDLGSTAAKLGAGDAAASLALLAGYAAAVVAIVLGLRRDREVGFMVTLGASLLLAPLLWDHYLAVLVLPAAFLAQRGRSMAILLPLLTWLPEPALPLIAVAATFLPLWARPTPAGHAAPGQDPGALPST